MSHCMMYPNQHMAHYKQAHHSYYTGPEKLCRSFQEEVRKSMTTISNDSSVHPSIIYSLIRTGAGDWSEEFAKLHCEAIL